MSEDDEFPLGQIKPLLKIFDIVPVAVQVFSLDGILQYANSAWENLWHASAEEAVGHFNAFEVELFADMGLRGLMEKARQGETVAFPDFELDPNDFGGTGRKRWIRSQAFTLPDEQDKTQYIVVTAYDITDQIETEIRYQENQEKLLEAQKLLILQERLGAIGQLASGIAHDFNNILAIILLEAQLLRQIRATEGDSDKRLNKIIEQSQRGAHLIRQVLDFSRISYSKKKPLNINEWFADFADVASRILPAMIDVDSQVLEQTYHIEADTTQLQQVFMNLIINARDAIDGYGSISFSMEYTDSLPSKFRNLTHRKEAANYIVLKIKDDGVGIAEEHLDNIFDPFFTTKAFGESSGLGLSQAYGIVKQHFGFIDCQSELGIGTTFLLYFPIIQKPENEISKALDRFNQQKNQKVILLVEDHPLSRQSIQDALEILDYTVLTAVNGEEALSLLEANEADVDLILSDIVMPKMSGILLYKAVKKQFPQIKTVFMTGFVSKESGEIEEALKDATILMKPFSIDKLEEILKEELQN